MDQNPSFDPFTWHALRDLIGKSPLHEELWVEPIEVVLVDMPRMQREIVMDWLEEADGITVAAVVSSEGKELDETLARAAAPRVVIGGSSVLDSPAVARLLEHRPGIRVLTFDADGRELTLFELAPRRARHEASRTGLVTAIREPGWAALEDGA